MIYYDIQHFGDIQWLPWLVKQLQHPENTFRISYDGDAKIVDSLVMKLGAESFRARQLRVERSNPIRWCGPSQVVNLIYSLRRALDQVSWQFFINLSGTCFPLQSQERLFQYLVNALEKGYSAHFYSFRLNKPVVLPEEDLSLTKVRARVGRLHLEGNARLIEMFRDPTYFPVTRPANRLYLSCEEPSDESDLLNVARPSPAELLFRQAYLGRYPHHCGRAWFIFHRSDCEKLVKFFDSSSFDESKALFFSAFQPDESFVQTLVMNRLVLSPESIGPSSLRAFEGSPMILNDENFHLLNNQQRAFFARKIQHAKAIQLRRLVEERVA